MGRVIALVFAALALVGCINEPDAFHKSFTETMVQETGINPDLETIEAARSLALTTCDVLKQGADPHDVILAVLVGDMSASARTKSFVAIKAGVTVYCPEFADDIMAR